MTSKREHYSADPQSPFYFYGGWLSSFFPWGFMAAPMAPVKMARVRPFLTREHWFAAHKTLDVRLFLEIAESATAGGAKRAGRRVTLRSGWDDGLAFAVMVGGIRHQTRHHDAIREKLLATGSRLIAEDSPTDFIWGIRSPGSMDGGRNLLGKAWMTVREELQSHA